MFRKSFTFKIIPLIFLVAGLYIGTKIVEIESTKISYPEPITSVQKYGPLKVGEYFRPRTYFPKEYPIGEASYSNFFVHAVQKDLSYCMFESCGMSGTLVACMEGWLSGNSHVEISDEVGLDDKWDDVLAGKASMIVVSDRKSKIVGLYPNATTHDIPRILKRHPDITNSAKECYEFNMPTGSIL